MNLDALDTRTKIGLGLAVACAVVAFIPYNDGLMLVTKALLFLGLLAFMYFGGASAGELEKSVQVVVIDVRDDRKESFRNALRTALGALGQVTNVGDSLDGTVSVYVSTKRHVDDVKKTADSCKLKMQFASAQATLRYTSLEASAEMLVAVTGKATPGSEVQIDGVRGAISVGPNGSFTAQIPLSVVRKNETRGFVPAKCIKGQLVDEIQIPIPR